jgi:hypothetical protein
MLTVIVLRAVLSSVFRASHVLSWNITKSIFKYDDSILRLLVLLHLGLDAVYLCTWLMHNKPKSNNSRASYCWVYKDLISCLPAYYTSLIHRSFGSHSGELWNDLDELTMEKSSQEAALRLKRSNSIIRGVRGEITMMDWIFLCYIVISMHPGEDFYWLVHYLANIIIIIVTYSWPCTA